MCFKFLAVKRLHWQDLRCEESSWEETWLEEKSPSFLNHTQDNLKYPEHSQTNIVDEYHSGLWSDLSKPSEKGWQQSGQQKD